MHNIFSIKRPQLWNWASLNRFSAQTFRICILNDEKKVALHLEGGLYLSELGLGAIKAYLLVAPSVFTLDDMSKFDLFW